MNRFLRVICFAFAMGPQVLWALSPEQVVASSLLHFPEVILSIQNLEQTKNQTLNARGAFDGKVVGGLDSRVQGYYNGDAYKLGLEKPLGLLNSKVYAGHRKGFGNFPTYEGKLETLDGGEMFAGLSLSLLKNALIDSSRHNLRYLKQNEEQATLDLRQVRINVQTLALKAYWTWYVEGHTLNVHRGILDLAQSRAQKIARRIRAGDLAKIYGVENDQYIVKRQALVSQSLLEFQQASYYLSLFYRDKNGLPRSLAREQLPPLGQKSLSQVNEYQTTLNTALKENLNLKILNSKETQAQLDILLGRNDLLPKLDLQFEWNQDQGVGPKRLGQDENRVMLKLEVPLQYRKGLGKKRAGQAKLAQVGIKKQWTTEKLKISVQTLVAKLNTFSEVYKLTSDQVGLAKKLVKAERRKFFQGASDLILVNLREENLAEAQSKNLESLLKYHFVEADIKKVLVDFIAQ